MPAENVAQLDLLNYECSWKASTLGLVKDADLSGLRPKLKDKVIGKLGDIPIDSVVIGMEGTVKITLHQVNKATIQQLCPWWTSGSTSLISSTRHYSRYGAAGVLLLHPVGVSGTDEDINFVKAFPTLILPSGDGVEWREVQTEWQIFPDQAQALTSNLLVYGYYGAVPS